MTFCPFENSPRYGRVYVDYFLPGLSTLNILDSALIKRVFVDDFPYFTRRETLHWPEYLREGMAFNGGMKWRRLRSLVSPIFSSAKLRDIYTELPTPMQQAIENIRTTAGISSSNDMGGEVEVRRLMKCLTLDILCRICFSASIDSYNQPDSKMVYHMLNAFKMSKLKLILLKLPAKFQNWLDISLINQTSSTWFGNFIKCLIQERKSHLEHKYNDFLQMLLNSEVSEELLAQQELELNVDQSSDKRPKSFSFSKHLSEKEIVGQILVFFFAGAETLTALFSEPLHLLAQHPDKQEKLYEEIMDKFPEGVFALDDPFKCKYLNAVIDEVQR